MHTLRRQYLIPGRASSRQRGFTLIELLVVVLIIGILVTIATISIGVLGEDSQLESEATRFTDVVELGLEQSQLEGRDFAVLLDDQGYDVRSFDGRTERWLTVEDDPWFRRRELPAGVVFSLMLEGRRIVLKREAELEEPQPQLILYASGDATPYELTLSRPGTPQRITLKGAANGTIEVSRDQTP
ncbi:MAG: type II secretion system minor pseudopilin GspH [Gammaproteobacteria bacterium]|nr:type II secretion system minor pseudopilin GspH [Gammaproteobacteria bacterium]